MNLEDTQQVTVLRKVKRGKNMDKSNWEMINDVKNIYYHLCDEENTYLRKITWGYELTEEEKEKYKNIKEMQIKAKQLLLDKTIPF